MRGNRMQPELLRVGSAARLLGINEKTLRAWFRKEQEQPGTGLKFIRFPSGERRVPSSEIERLLTVVTK